LCVPGTINTPPPLAACTNDDQCRGGVCDTTTGLCSLCIQDADCPAGSFCDPIKGWCFKDVVTPTACDATAPCTAGSCMGDVQFCSVDPYDGCRNDEDCHPGTLCSEERGYCLDEIFFTAQCETDADCAAGTCDQDLEWCLPNLGSNDQCRHDDDCPFGDCLQNRYCDQQTFVFPKQFKPDVDCLTFR